MQEETNKVLEALRINPDDVLNVYLYGSQVYGCAKENSDRDFAIVYKKSFLPSGAFVDNAKSSDDKTIQGVCYSRGGFIDAINNYEMRALQCLFAPDSAVLQRKFKFSMQSYREADMVKKIITQASDRWFTAHQNFYDFENVEIGKKFVYHAIRILLFGMQLKNSQRITDFSAANQIRQDIYADRDFTVKKYLALRDEMMESLRTKVPC